MYWWTLWGLGLAVAVAGIGTDLANQRLDVVLGRDFSNLWTAGRLALAGEAWLAFDLDSFRLGLLQETGKPMLQNYSYPPHALFIAAPFALLPYPVALAAWTVAGAIFFMWAARPYLPRNFHPLLVIATPAAGINIWNGHYGFLLGGLWLMFFSSIATKPGRAGVYAGLLTFKPHMGVLIALLCLTRLRMLLVAVGTTLLLVILSSVAFSPNSWMMFLVNTTAAQGEILTRESHDFYFRMMPSAYVGFGQGISGVIAQAVFGSLAAALLVRARRIDPFAWSTATFLTVPYVFNYDMTVPCLGFALMLHQRWKYLASWERVILSLAFLSPNLTYFAAWFVSPILLGALWIMHGREDLPGWMLVRRQKHSATEPHMQ